MTYFLDLRLKLIDIMLIFDILNDFVIYPEILDLIYFHISPKHTPDLDWIIVQFYKTNITTGNTNLLLPRALLFTSTIYTILEFLVCHVSHSKLML